MKNVVVVPIYRHPTGTEKCALRQCAAVFHRQDICIIYPRSLDIRMIWRYIPICEVSLSMTVGLREWRGIIL